MPPLRSWAKANDLVSEITGRSGVDHSRHASIWIRRRKRERQSGIVPIAPSGRAGV